MSEYLFKTEKEIMTCNECPMSEQLKIENCWYCKLLHDIAVNNTKNTDCPLVEVPPHGDLIERDKLPQNHITDYNLEGHSVVDLEDVQTAPIILEASTKERE